MEELRVSYHQHRLLHVLVLLQLQLGGVEPLQAELEVDGERDEDGDGEAEEESVDAGVGPLLGLRHQQVRSQARIKT